MLRTNICLQKQHALIDGGKVVTKRLFKTFKKLKVKRKLQFQFQCLRILQLHRIWRVINRNDEYVTVDESSFW